MNIELTPSANFRFLKHHNELMLGVAVQAERYVFDDPNVCLIKLRQLTELLALDIAARTGVYVGAEENLLNRLRDAGILDNQVSQLFHTIRRTGNAAVHNPQQSTQREVAEADGKKTKKKRANRK